jgi:hypothetical protein
MLTFGQLLDRIEYALGDVANATWDRANTLWGWAIEGIRELPFLVPIDTDIKPDTGKSHEFTLPEAAVSVISAEYPIGNDPPTYLIRKSHLEPDFFTSDRYYDVDRHFREEEGLRLWTSASVDSDDSVRVELLCRHNTVYSVEATETDIPDEHINLVVLYVVWTAWQERLSKQLQNPTAYNQVIGQIQKAVELARQNYLSEVERALQEQNNSRYIQGWKIDQWDRIY